MVNAHGLHWHRSSRDVNLRTSTHGRGFDSPGRLPIGEPGDVAVESRCVIEAAIQAATPVSRRRYDVARTSERKVTYAYMLKHPVCVPPPAGICERRQRGLSAAGWLEKMVIIENSS